MVVTKKGGSPKIIGIVFVLFSMLTVLIGAKTGYDSGRLKKKCTESVTAEIVENIALKSRTKTKHGHKTVTTYKPVYDFEYNGTAYRVESSIASNPAVFDVGEKTEVKVNPADPQEIFVPADKSANYATIICITVAAIFLIVGIFLFIKL